MKYLVCYDGSEESSRALSFVQTHAAKGDQIVLWGAFAPVLDPNGAAHADDKAHIFIPPKEEWSNAEAGAFPHHFSLFNDLF
jgi:hypothetical protein